MHANISFCTSLSKSSDSSAIHNASQLYEASYRVSGLPVKINRQVINNQMRLDELLQKSKPWVTILNKLQDEPRFKVWFKNSKVVDKKGLPLIVYHSGYGDWRLPNPFTHFGTYIAARKKYNDDRDFRGIDGFTMPFILSLQNPLLIDDLCNHRPSDYDRYLQKAVSNYGKDIIDYDYYADNKNVVVQQYQNIRKEVEKNGIDGFQYTNVYEHKGSTSYIILRPAQAMPLFKLAKLVL